MAIGDGHSGNSTYTACQQQKTVSSGGATTAFTMLAATLIVALAALSGGAKAGERPLFRVQAYSSKRIRFRTVDCVTGH